MAQLAPVVDSLETVAAPAREYYVQKDGKYHLDLSGAPVGFAPVTELTAANAKVVEFRDKNVALMQEVEPLRKLKTDVGDLDIPAAKTAMTKVTELEKKGVKDAGDISKLVSEAVAAATKPLADQLGIIAKREEEAVKGRDALALRTSLGERFTKAGGQPDALDFMVNRAQGVFKIVDGKLVAEANQYSADRPGEPLTVEEWMTRQTKEVSFAFKPSSGGGANPAAPGSAASVGKPGQLVIKNPTPNQLGQYAADLKAGKVRFEYDQPSPAVAGQ